MVGLTFFMSKRRTIVLSIGKRTRSLSDERSWRSRRSRSPTRRWRRWRCFGGENQDRDVSLERLVSKLLGHWAQNLKMQFQLSTAIALHFASGCCYDRRPIDHSGFYRFGSKCKSVSILDFKDSVSALYWRPVTLNSPSLVDLTHRCLPDWSKQIYKPTTWMLGWNQSASRLSLIKISASRLLDFCQTVAIIDQNRCLAHDEKCPASICSFRPNYRPSDGCILFLKQSLFLYSNN